METVTGIDVRVKSMIFSRNMYIGEGIRHPLIIKQKLRLHRLLTGVYILRLAENKEDHVEIINGIYFKQPLAYRENNHIVGFASSDAEAMVLVEKMMQDCVSETGTVNLRKYLIQKSQRTLKG